MLGYVPRRRNQKQGHCIQSVCVVKSHAKNLLVYLDIIYVARVLQ